MRETLARTSLPACNWCETGTFSAMDAWNRAKTTLVSSVPTLGCRPTHPSWSSWDKRTLDSMRSSASAKSADSATGCRSSRTSATRCLDRFTAMRGRWCIPRLQKGSVCRSWKPSVCHAPVLTSYGSALSEIGGDAVLLVDATSENEIASGLMRLLYDDDLLRELRTKSAARAQEFRWEASAAAVASAYRALFQPPLQL